MNQAAPSEPVTWTDLKQALTRPYPVTLPMVVLVSLIPLYLLIGLWTEEGRAFAPATSIDAALPLVPAWSLIYGALYLYLITLPILVVQDRAVVDRTVHAYLTVWLVSYAFFILVPTIAPRPEEVNGGGFAAWGLRGLYGADPPYNCFPSLHVAHSFVSALACRRIHRGLGVVALIFAGLVALSTLFTKQHYVVDLVAGIFLATVACGFFYRDLPKNLDDHLQQRVAPTIAGGLAGIILLGVVGFWLIYRLQQGRLPLS